MVLLDINTVHTTVKKETCEYLLKLTYLSVNGNEIYYSHTVLLLFFFVKQQRFVLNRKI